MRVEDLAVAGDAFVQFLLVRWRRPEVETLGLETFAERVLVDACGLGWWPSRLCRCRPGGRDTSPVAITELECAGYVVGEIGIAGDPEVPTMVLTVVMRADEHEIPRVGRTVVFPVDDVMHIEPVRDGAAWNATSMSVTSFDDRTRAVGDDPLGATDRDGDTVGDEHR